MWKFFLPPRNAIKHVCKHEIWGNNQDLFHIVVWLNYTGYPYSSKLISGTLFHCLAFRLGLRQCQCPERCDFSATQTNVCFQGGQLSQLAAEWHELSILSFLQGYLQNRNQTLRWRFDGALHPTATKKRHVCIRYEIGIAAVTSSAIWFMSIFSLCSMTTLAFEFHSSARILQVRWTCIRMYVGRTLDNGETHCIVRSGTVLRFHTSRFRRSTIKQQSRWNTYNSKT